MKRLMGVLLLTGGWLAFGGELTECNIICRDGDIRLWSDNGVALRLDPAGRVLAVNEKAVEPSPLIYFEEVVPVEGAADLLAGRDWTAWGVKPEQVSADGVLSIAAGEDRNGELTLALRQRQATPLILSGECAYRNASETGGWMNRHLALNVTGKAADGYELKEQSAYFGQYDHDFQYNERIICPDRPLQELVLQVTSNARDNCRADFRNLTLKEAAYRIFAPNGTMAQRDQRLIQEFDDPQNGLKGLIYLQPGCDHIEIGGFLENTRHDDRALSCYIAIPVDAVGGEFYQSLRRSGPIEANQWYRNADRWYGGGRDGYEALYPLTALTTAAGEGLALGTDIDAPRVFYMGYDAAGKVFWLRYDLGFSPDAGGQWRNRNSFHACLFGFQPVDGMRGAAENYQQIYDWAFLKKRATREGVWLAFLSPRIAPGGDEGLNYGQIESIGDFAYNEERGYNSFYYIEPWIHHHDNQYFYERHREPWGPSDPAGAIKTAREVAAENRRDVPDQERYRHQGYPANYITDNWGMPQGYFFRQPGRHENMMIVDPNIDIAPEDGAFFSTGRLDWFIEQEALRRVKQFVLDGWAPERTSLRPVFEMEKENPFSGERSIRIDPVINANCFEFTKQILHQTGIVPPAGERSFHLKFAARGRDTESSGARFSVNVTAYYADDSSETLPVNLETLPEDWQEFEKTLEFERTPVTLTVSLCRGMKEPTPATVWLDRVSLVAGSDGRELIRNGDFETVRLHVGKTTGAYLDTMECYANNLNYRRDHWRVSPNPPTFDSARNVALQQQYAHVAFTKSIADYLHNRDRLVFANCAGTIPFGAPYIDVFGDEQNWMSGDRWTPAEDDGLLFRRFISRAKPYNMLQYADLDVAHMRRYFSRLGFYGIYPSMQAAAPTGMWYWPNPNRVQAHRALYAEFIPVLKRINQVGWTPVTLARSDNPEVWLERFGEGNEQYLTVFNSSTDREQQAVLTFDDRLPLAADGALRELFSGTVRASDGRRLEVTLQPEQLLVLQVTGE